jgi:hypothetical protein
MFYLSPNKGICVGKQLNFGLSLISRELATCETHVGDVTAELQGSEITKSAPANERSSSAQLLKLV